MKNQNNQRLQTVLLATIATIFLLGAFSPTFAQGIGAKYGTKTSMIARPNISSSRSQALWFFSGSQNPNPITDNEARRQLIVDSSPA